MNSQFVKVYGNKIEVKKDGVLVLSNMNIKDISDIKGLESLAELQYLILDRNQITEIKGLESLANLQHLILNRNQITEIKGLESLANLQYLNLNRNQITEIKGLESLANLQFLILNRNQIIEIKGLESLANLHFLILDRNQITEIKGLESLVNLQYLNLDRNQITEIKGLESLAKLEELNLDRNQITEIKGLGSLANLDELSLNRNQITEIKGLEFFDYLQKLNLYLNQITEIKGLESLDVLKELILNRNQITEIKGLESLVSLSYLNLDNNQITEIKGLESLAELQYLILNSNQITEIKGLESLANLQYLNLDNNQITEIKGLESLANLKKLFLLNNRIPEDLVKELGNDPKKYINYWRKEAKRLETEKKVTEDTKMIHKILQLAVDNQKEVDKAEIVRSLSFSIQEANKYLKLLNSSIEYESNEVQEFMPKAEEIVSKFAEPTLYDLLNDLELDFYAAKKIGKYLTDEGFFKEFPNYPKVKVEVKTTIFKESRESGDYSPNDVKVLRGGDWKVEGNQSVFYYKVKVKNNSPFVITNIQIILGGIPAGLELKSKKLVEFANLNPKKEVAPTFNLLATDDCVGNEILSTVNFKDHNGKRHSVHTKPFDIEYVCNLLRPKYISKDKFDRAVNSMEEKKLVVDSFLNLTDLESKIEQIVKNCNFALLQDVKGAQDKGFARIEAFAEGIYDKQDVALSVAIQKVDDGSKLIVKAMSDRSEKVTDLLRDFSVKLDDIKSDTELIKEYTSQIESIFDRVDDLEAYLKDHLASDWEKIKDDYADYKEGKITRKQLIGRGIKCIGKRFVKKIIEKVSPI